MTAARATPEATGSQFSGGARWTATPTSTSTPEGLGQDVPRLRLHLEVRRGGLDAEHGEEPPEEVLRGQESAEPLLEQRHVEVDPPLRRRGPAPRGRLQCLRQIEEPRQRAV